MNPGCVYMSSVKNSNVIDIALRTETCRFVAGWNKEPKLRNVIIVVM